MNNERANLELLRLKCRKAGIHFEERLNEDLPVLLNRECECSVSGPTFVSESDLRDYVGGKRDFWVSLRLDDVTGNPSVLIHLPFAVGISISGLLLVMADNRIRERIEEGETSEDDLDVLYEVGNQLRGCLMRSLRKAAHRDVHLSLNYAIQSGGVPEGLPSGFACIWPITLRISRLVADRFEVISDLAGLASLFGVQATRKDFEILAEPAETEGIGEKPGYGEQSSSNGMTAVVIEGSPEGNRLPSLLKILGFRVVDFGTVQELAGLLQKHSVHLIVIDADENVTKAIRLAQLLRSFSRSCKIFVGAHTWRKEQIFQGVRAGVNGFLVKPYEAESLRQKLVGLHRSVEPKQGAEKQTT